MVWVSIACTDIWTLRGSMSSTEFLDDTGLIRYKLGMYLRSIVTKQQVHAITRLLLCFPNLDFKDYRLLLLYLDGL